MAKLFLRTSAWAISVALAVSSCTQHVQYRTDYEPCARKSPLSPADCPSNALQEYRDLDGVEPDESYTLGFIEFDDQGLLFKRRQMRAVLDAVREKLVRKDMLIVVFMHGWKHNAAPDDGNIKEFRQLLMNLSAAESHIRGEKSRDVMGIYLGWRGLSIYAPVLRQLTFWDRKNTAHKVGRGGVTEVLARLERIKERRGRNTTLTIVGHSFGGAAIYDALSQVLEARFARTVDAPNTQGGIEGFGNLVVLINPAFEALQYATLSDMSTEYAPYRESQLPLLAVLTSEGDKATKYAFKVGRWFSTLFEKERDTKRCNATIGETESIDERAANVTAIGHFAPYETHVLRAPRAQVQVLKHSMGVQSPNFLKIGAQWRRDRPGSKIAFTRSILKRTPTSAGRNPYLVVRVDKKLIQHHNDILDDSVVDFVRQLILISSQTPAQSQEIRELAATVVSAPAAASESNADACHDVSR
ncbi:MAG: esterase [Gammaproteobacteria bacterium]